MFDSSLHWNCARRIVEAMYFVFNSCAGNFRKNLKLNGLGWKPRGNLPVGNTGLDKYFAVCICESGICIPVGLGIYRKKKSLVFGVKLKTYCNTLEHLR